MVRTKPFGWTGYVFQILTAKGKVIHCSSVWPVQANNNNDERNKEHFDDYTQILRQSLGAQMIAEIAEDEKNDDEFANDTPTFVPYEVEASKQQKAIEIEHDPTDSFDKLISAQVSLPISGIQQKGCVIRWKRDHAGNPGGKYSSNPYHDTSLYDVEFNDGHVESFPANLIAQHIYEQLDDDGNCFCLIEEIIDHRKDKSAVLQENKMYMFKGKTYT